MDNTKVRTASELERKYNLGALTGSILAVKANIETNSKDIIKVNSQLTDMLKSLVINLGDTLQSSVSLWFYSGEPTTENKPYTDWVTISEHYDDLYYDQDSGYVYKFTSNGWIRQYDISLINALALTNSELDVSTDHERKVYLEQPVPPYSSGDWWIQTDGTLKICQLGKNSGVYEDIDFVMSTMYTTTIASKENDTITVLKGTVTEITRDYVKYTDLSTGGSTTIDGSNITTGKIRSSNYVQGTSGSELDLVTGALKTKNVNISDSGVALSNGAEFINYNGVLTSMIIPGELVSNEFAGASGMLPFGVSYSNGTTYKGKIEFAFTIPKDFIPTKAYIVLEHMPSDNQYYGDYGLTTTTGYCRNLKLYKGSNISNSKYKAYFTGVGTMGYSNVNFTHISDAFGSSGYTGSNSLYTQKISEKDLTQYIDYSSSSDKFNIWKIESDISASSYADAMSKTGACKATLMIIGRTKYQG